MVECWMSLLEDDKQPCMRIVQGEPEYDMLETIFGQYSNSFCTKWSDDFIVVME
jgi:hypothetical protein